MSISKDLIDNQPSNSDEVFDNSRLFSVIICTWRGKILDFIVEAVWSKSFFELKGRPLCLVWSVWS